ncbi:MAG: hypothetical protein ABIS03_14520 [Gemmatimonadaceae bacterium]
MGRKLAHSILLATACALTLACASAGTGSNTGSRTMLTREEIAAANTPSAYDVVNRLRPDWLRSAQLSASGGSSRTMQVLVYVDGFRMGGAETLRSINAGTVRSMEYASASKAPSVVRDMGSGVASAVILVITQ